MRGYIIIDTSKMLRVTESILRYIAVMIMLTNENMIYEMNITLLSIEIRQKSM